MKRVANPPPLPLPLVWSVGVLALLVLLCLVCLVMLFRSRAAQNRALEQDLEQMRKQLETMGSDLSRKLAAISAASVDSGQTVAELQTKLSKMDEQLRQLVSSLTRVETKLPEFVEMGRKLQDLRGEAERVASETSSAAMAVARFEDAHDDALKRIAALEQSLVLLEQESGTAKVEPNRAAIEDATRRAVRLAWREGVTPESELAKRVAAEEGERILAALDAAANQDVDGAAAIVEASAFDPFALRQDLWEGAIQAKRTLQLARAAAGTAMEPFGFVIETPKVGEDLYNREAHDLRDSIATENELLKGKIAEVRRPGLRFHGKVVRPARVVQYAIDYTRAPQQDAISPVQTPEPAAPDVERMEQEPADRKKGVAEF